VEGFSDLTSQLAVGADSVVLAVCMRGALKSKLFL
jgi:hypothetical protein